jgi:hypothetical protein
MSPETNGSMTRALGYFAAATFIAASASQNALHGWQLGLRTSEVTATIFAAASVAGAVMAPIALAATVRAFREWQIPRGVLALVLAATCFAYAVVSSLGFVSGARDAAAATRGAEADAYAIARDKAKAANRELAAMAELPRGNRKTEAERAERRAKLERDRADAEKVMVTGATATMTDPTASALATYAASLGFDVKADALSPWLVLASVIFFELGSAASLIVVGGLPRGAAAELDVDVADNSNTEAPADKKAVGRKRSRALDDVMSRIEGAGGKLEGSVEEIGARLGLSKSSAHRALHALAGAGMISLATSTVGTLVQKP